MAHSSLEIANEFLQFASAKGVFLTQMQLQKLDYLAHGFFLAEIGKPLIEDTVEAWGYGTVYPKLRDATKKYGRFPVSKLIRWGDDQIIPSVNRKVAIAELTPAENRTIRKVWTTYGKYPAFKLSALTHDPNGPWAECYVEGENRVIPNDLIRQYFKRISLSDERSTA